MEQKKKQTGNREIFCLFILFFAESVKAGNRETRTFKEILPLICF
jgi:predicted Kef-type K+ transport protein